MWDDMSVKLMWSYCVYGVRRRSLREEVCLFYYNTRAKYKPRPLHLLKFIFLLFKICFYQTVTVFKIEIFFFHWKIFIPDISFVTAAQLH